MRSSWTWGGGRVAVVECGDGNLEIIALVFLKLLLASSGYQPQAPNFLSLSSQKYKKRGGDVRTELMDMNAFNVSATLNVFKLLTRPALCLPHATISTFNQLPVPLNSAFGKYKNVDIRAVVLDKDNCFAIPHSNEVYGPYEVRFCVPFQQYHLGSLYLHPIYEIVNRPSLQRYFPVCYMSSSTTPHAI